MEENHRNSAFESPLRYPGGKTCLFPFVSKLFYENRLIGSSYAEPYAGGAGLALKLLFNEYVDRILINDLDPVIYKFWQTTVNHNLIFCDWLEDVKVNIDSWKYYKSILQTSHDHNDIEIAKAAFFLNRTNISGVIKGGVIGGYQQLGKYKIDARFNKSDLLKRLRRIDEFNSRIIISNLDGIRFINNMNKQKGSVFIYIDPPYVAKGAELYMNYYIHRDHERLSRNLKKINKKWLLTYDNNDFILSLYKQQRKLVHKLSQSTSNRVGNEIIVFSDSMNYEKSQSELRDVVHI